VSLEPVVSKSDLMGMSLDIRCTIHENDALFVLEGGAKFRHKDQQIIADQADAKPEKEKKTKLSVSLVFGLVDLV
jgi:hypothetical protein